MGKAHQALTGIAASFAAMLMGSLSVWPSYTLKLYTSQNTTVLSEPMNELQASLVGSLPSLGAMLGTVISGVTINVFGRKRGAILLVLPYTVHWVIIELSSTVTPIIIARFIGGIAGGAYVVYVPIYISEICEPSIRGALATVTFVYFFLGALVSYMSGWFLSYGTNIWVNLALCALNLILLSLVEESPLFLLRQNKEQAALKALAHYRDGSTSSKNVQEELSAMKQQLSPPVELVDVYADTKAEEAEIDKLNVGNEDIVVAPKVPSWKLLFTTTSNRRAFFVVFTLTTMQVLMGVGVVQVYAGELFAKAAPGQSADFCSVLVALLCCAGAGLAAAIADKAGRKVLVISSSVLAALCIGSLGVQLQLGAPPALAAGTILAFCFVFSYGAGTVPFILLVEVFSPEVQSIASTIIVESIWFSNFILIAVFPFLVSLVGMHGAFYAFACVCAANALYSRAYLPETKGKSGREIQAMFNK